MDPLTCRALETRIFAAGEDLVAFIVNHVPTHLVAERMVLAVTTKIVSLAENRTVAKSTISKARLIQNEADTFLGPIAHGSLLTIKHGLFIASSGIDESNSAHDDYILYPVDPDASARRLWEGLRSHWDLKELGIILTDSRTQPLRRGVTGVALSHWGFSGVRDLIGEKDLFGRPLKMTQVNVVDALSAVAVLTMGEGGEARPLAILGGTQIQFRADSDRKTLLVDPAEDLYAPFFNPNLRRE